MAGPLCRLPARLAGPRVPLVRGRAAMRGRPPGQALTLQQRLQRLEQKTLPVNIGFRHTERRREQQQLEHRPLALQTVAQHYGVFEQLFGSAYFTPVLPLSVRFGDGSPVCCGNVVSPTEASSAPAVRFSASPDSLWTLVCTDLEGEGREEGTETLLWLLQNMPAGEVGRADLVVPYRQPLPPRGTGFHRVVFVVYRQEGPVEVDTEVNMETRRFSSRRFYGRLQSQLTPAGLAFCQCQWDPSVTAFFHQRLGRAEPVYRPIQAEPYLQRQRWFPKGRSVVHYLDRYLDRRQLQRQMLLLRLADVHPFLGTRPPPKYPAAVPIENRPSVPTWLVNEKKKQARAISKYYFINRHPETVFDATC